MNDMELKMPLISCIKGHDTCLISILVFFPIRGIRDVKYISEQVN